MFYMGKDTGMTPQTLADFTGNYNKSGTQRNYEHCPVCGSDGKKLYVDPRTGMWFCFAGQHHSGGKVDVGLDDRSPGQDLLDLIAPAEDELIWQETELPPFESLTPIARDYLKRRGLSNQEMITQGLVVWTGQYRVLFPYFKGGELIFWTSRRYSEVVGTGPKYLSQPGSKPLYEPITIPPVSPGTLVLVEGVLDALAVNRAGFKAVALGGKNLAAHNMKNVLTLAENCGIIVVLLDGDALDAALKIQDALSSRTKAHVGIWCCDDDPGNMSVEELRKLLP
jgi:hypothetical protein